MLDFLWWRKLCFMFGLWSSLREKDEMWWREMKKSKSEEIREKKGKKKEKKEKERWGIGQHEGKSVLSNLLGPRQFAIIYERDIWIHFLKPKNYYESNHINGCKTLPKKRKKSASFWHILTQKTLTSVIAKVCKYTQLLQ